jgi:hypothetical protein
MHRRHLAQTTRAKEYGKGVSGVCSDCRLCCDVPRLHDLRGGASGHVHIHVVLIVDPCKCPAMCPNLKSSFHTLIVASREGML